MTITSHWVYFHVAILLLMGVEYLVHRAVPNIHRKAVYATILWTVAALVFAFLLIKPYGRTGALEYLAGYAIEQSLSIDNLFVFLLLFGIFRITPEHQPRVLFWGVLGAIVMRGGFIAGGVGLLEHFHWVEYLFAAILLFAAIRLLKPESESTDPNATPAWVRWITRWQPISDRQDKFLVRESPAPGKPRVTMATMLLLSLVAVELTDVVFALDSIPAVLSITRDPFLAYTSNIMAVMNLRSLYVLLAVMLNKLRYIHFGLAALLGFAALKMLAADWITISPLISLGIIAGLLAITVIASLFVGPAKPNTA